MENEETKKKCNACLVEKSICEFYKDSKNKDKLATRCKYCVENRVKMVRDYTVQNNLKICSVCKTEQELYNFYNCETCSDNYKSACKVCYKELYFDTQKDNRFKNKERLTILNKKWREDNKDYLKQERKNYYNKNKKQVIKKNSEYVINRLKIDPIYKLIHSIRTLIRNSFKRGCKKHFKKEQKSESILGCTIQEFMEHLQSLFIDRMTLENHGNCAECWHIDHKIPISSAKTEEEIIKLNHYTNLQPLWRFDNLSKGKKY